MDGEKEWLRIRSHFPSQKPTFSPTWMPMKNDKVCPSSTLFSLIMQNSSMCFMYIGVNEKLFCKVCP